jgi:hypothetical protein
MSQHVSEKPEDEFRTSSADHAGTHQPLGADSQDMTLSGLLAALEAARGRALSFRYDGRVTKPGYHVTEMKFARMTGVDCGGNAESWTETIIQLWDIDTSVTGETMTIDKLIGIARKVAGMIGAEATSRLTFEVSDGDEAMRIYAFEGLDVTGERATIRLGQRVSACKPLVRGLLPEPGIKGACGPKVMFANVDKKPPCCSA